MVVTRREFTSDIVRMYVSRIKKKTIKRHTFSDD